MLHCAAWTLLLEMCIFDCQTSLLTSAQVRALQHTGHSPDLVQAGGGGGGGGGGRVVVIK